jgi:hypothetical protein
MLCADSGASRVILSLAQRPTKRLLTFGTRLYDDLCCMLRGRKVVGTAVRLNGPRNKIGEGAKC